MYINDSPLLPNNWRTPRLEAAVGISAAVQWVTARLSFSHSLWKSFTVETAYIAEPTYYLGERRRDVLIFIFRRSKFFQKVQLIDVIL